MKIYFIRLQDFEFGNPNFRIFELEPFMKKLKDKLIFPKVYYDSSTFNFEASLFACS